MKIEGFTNEEIKHSIESANDGRPVDGLVLEETGIDITPTIHSVVPETFKEQDLLDLSEDADQKENEDGIFDLEEDTSKPEQQEQVQEQQAVSSLSDKPLDTFSVEGKYLMEFMSKCSHLDKRESTAYINFLCLNNMLYCYGLNIGIHIMACYPCDYKSTSPLYQTIQLNKLAKQVNKDRIYTFTFDTKVHLSCSDTVATKHVSWNLPQKIFEKETLAIPERFYKLTEYTWDDIIPNTDMKDLLTLLSTYLKLNQQKDRNIAFDKQFVFVKGIGFYAFARYATKKKYVFTERIASMLQGLSTLSTKEGYNLFFRVTSDNKYEINAFNYIMQFPINQPDARFNVVDSIKPTILYEVGLTAFKEVLSDVDTYSDTDCAITLGKDITIINKNVEGNATGTLTPLKIVNFDGQPLDSVPTGTYPFNHLKLTNLITRLKGTKFILSIATTNQHLLLSDENMKHSVLLSIR